MAGPVIPFEPARQLEPIDTGNVEVGHHNIWLKTKRAVERLQTIVRLLDAKACLSQPLRVHTTTVLIVFAEEHARARISQGHLILPDKYMVGSSPGEQKKQVPARFYGSFSGPGLMRSGLLSWSRFVNLHVEMA